MKCRLMVLDDDIINIKLIQNYLGDYPVLDFYFETDPLGALERVQAEKFHIILSDISMPVMDGLTFLRKVKEIDSLVHFIMMTSYSSINKVASAMESGAHDFVLKPFTNPAELREVINQSIARWNRWDRVLKDSAEKGHSWDLR